MYILRHAFVFLNLLLLCSWAIPLVKLPTWNEVPKFIDLDTFDVLFTRNNFAVLLSLLLFFVCIFSPLLSSHSHGNVWLCMLLRFVVSCSCVIHLHVQNIMGKKERILNEISTQNGMELLVRVRSKKNESDDDGGNKLFHKKKKTKKISWSHAFAKLLFSLKMWQEHTLIERNNCDTNVSVCATSSADWFLWAIELIC